MNDTTKGKTEMNGPEIAIKGPDAEADTPFRRFISDYSDNKIATVAAVVLGAIIFIAIFAPLISPQNPYDLAQVSILDSKLVPGSKSLDGWKNNII